MSAGLLAAGCALAGAAVTLAAIGAVPVRRRPSPAVEVIERGYGHRRAVPLRTAPRRPGLIGRRMSPGSRASLQQRLDAAGNPPGWTAERILAGRVLSMAALGAVFAMYGLVLHRPVLMIPGVALGLAGGYAVPSALLSRAGEKRRGMIARALPDAADMLTICVEAGAGLDQAFAQAAAGVGGPLGAEMSRALAEIGIGKSRSRALRDMAARAGVPEVRTFAASLVQADEQGTRIADVLRDQARQLREIRRQRAEEQAQKMTVKIVFPLVFCLLPALFAVIIGPAAIEIARTLLHA